MNNRKTVLSTWCCAAWLLGQIERMKPKCWFDRSFSLVTLTGLPHFESPKNRHFNYLLLDRVCHSTEQ